MDREAAKARLRARLGADPQAVADLETLLRAPDTTRAPIEALPDGVMRIDPDGRCAWCNKAAARALGAKPEAIIGQSALARFVLSDEHETRADAFVSVWASVHKQFSVRFDRASIERGEGEPLSVSCTFSPITEEGGEVGGCLLVFRDVSALRRDADRARRESEMLRAARDEALGASRSKSAFLANMSHELRTPLNAIIGYAELVAEDAAPLEEGTILADVTKIRGAAEQLLTMINDVLDLSKIEAGRMEFFAEPFQLAPLLDEIADTIAPLAQKNGNRLEIRLDPQLGVRLHTDRLKLRQSLLNLAANACKFTRDGSIVIRALIAPGAPGRALFSVEDDGPGIESDRLEQLFEPFIQASDNTSRVHGGTGLGLAITRRFVRMLGGEVWARSEVGRGSTFEFTIPLRTLSDPSGDLAPPGLEEVTEVVGRAGRVAPDRGDARYTVLCVDDDAAVGELVTRFLPRNDYRVLHARGAAEGIELARLERPDLITLDVLMPRADGWSALAKLKSDPDLSAIPVVMLSVTAERQRGYALGAADYLVKPIQRGRLAAVVRRYCGASGSVLVVEDDPETRSILERMLGASGWQVRSARDGREALSALAQSTPDVMLLDLMMPHLDGFELIDRVRRDPATSQVPVVVLTAMDLDAEQMRRLHEGAAEVMTKASASSGAIVDQIRAALNAPPSADGEQE